MREDLILAALEADRERRLSRAAAEEALERLGEACAAALEAGVPNSELARRLDVSRAEIARWARKHRR